MKKYILTCVVALLLTPVFAAFAAEEEAAVPLTLEQREQIEQQEKLKGTLEEARNKMDQQIKETNNACMKSFGHSSFCECLAKKLPSGIEFSSYVAIVSATKEQVDYDKLSESDKGTFNSTRTVRDQCVKEAGIQ